MTNTRPPITRFIQASSGMRAELHARAAHAQDRGDEIHAAPPIAADSREQKDERPIVRAVARREGRRRERRVGEPAHVRRAARLR